MNENKDNVRLGMFVPPYIDEYINNVKKEMKAIHGGRVSTGMAVSEIVRRLKEYEEKEK